MQHVGPDFLLSLCGTELQGIPWMGTPLCYTYWSADHHGLQQDVVDVPPAQEACTSSMDPGLASSAQEAEHRGTDEEANAQGH